MNAEPGTISWFAIQEGPSAFAIFDTFDDEAGRDAHLNGRGGGLDGKGPAGDLLQAPGDPQAGNSRGQTSKMRAAGASRRDLSCTQQTTRVPDRMDAGPNGPTPTDWYAVPPMRGDLRRGRSALSLRPDLSKQSRPSRFSGVQFPERCRAANPAATTAAVAAFFATCLSFEPPGGVPSSWLFGPSSLSSFSRPSIWRPHASMWTWPSWT